jgi:hypothetical protein
MHHLGDVMAIDSKSFWLRILLLVMGCLESIDEILEPLIAAVRLYRQATA